MRKEYIRPDRRYEWREERACQVCGKKFMPYLKVSRFCSPRCHNRKYIVFMREDPIKYKALKLAGKNKGITRKDVEKMLRKTVGKPCKYCKQIFLLKDASLDHKDPCYWTHKKTEKELKEINNIKNLHIVCRSCNFTKQDLTDEEFTKLMNFFRENPAIKEKLLNKAWIISKNKKKNKYGD